MECKCVKGTGVEMVSISKPEYEALLACKEKLIKMHEEDEKR